nr:tetratricopeptide repeat protein [Acanthopleuribacter pedis]
MGFPARRITLQHEDPTSPSHESPTQGPGHAASAYAHPTHIGPYTLVRRLGRGGMGAVYLGERRQPLFMQVAVKLIRKDGDTASLQHHFQQERRLLADLKHPNISTLLDAGTTEDGHPWFIMEYIPGTTIDRWAQERQPTVTQLLALFIKVVNAVGFAHERGIIHRDIKPSNLMVTPDGEPKLLDFGIALPAQPDVTPDIAGAMTPEYASPEQQKGNRPSRSSDIYALGLLLLQLLTGRRPKNWTITPLTLIATLRGPETAERLSEKGTLPASPAPTTRLPEVLAYLLRRMLAPNPADRYSDIASLRPDLEDALVSLSLGQTREDTEPATQGDVLLWTHPDHDAAAVPLDECLRAAGLSVWFAGRNLQPGASRLATLLAALRSHRTCLVCLGPDGKGPWSRMPALADAVTALVTEDRLHARLFLLPGAEWHPDAADIPAVLRRLRPMGPSIDERLPQNLSENAPQKPKDTPAGLVCPYRGLEPFREADRDAFFGRERLVEQLLDQTLTQPLVCVAGNSGSGKSSLINAGLIPACRDRGDLVLVMRPGTLPLSALAHALAPLLPQDQNENQPNRLTLRMKTAKEALHFVLRELSDRHGGKRVLLVIDPFEEVFTNEGTGARHFMENLDFLLSRQHDNLVPVLGMRSDFLGHCATWPMLNELICKHMLQVGPMNREQQARAIREPAALAGLALEPGLTTRILDDLAGSDGELPLLEHALLELFERRNGHLLTNEAYAEIGGIGGALARRAEEEFAAATPEEQASLRRLFVFCLVHAAARTRRRATMAEVEPFALGRLLERWTKARLLHIGYDAVQDCDMVDVTHEALIRKWDRVDRWLEEDRHHVHQVQRLRQAAHHWAEHERDPELLPRGGPLQRLEELLETAGLQLTEVERAYVEHAVAARTRAREAEETQRRAKLQRYQQRALRGRLLAVFLVVLISSFALTLWVQLQRTDQARQDAQRATDFLSTLISELDPGTQGDQTLTVADILDLGERRLEENFVNQPEAGADLLLTIATGNLNLARYDIAERQIARVAALREKADPIARAAVFKALGHLHEKQGNYGQSREALEEALALRRAGGDPADGKTGRILIELGWIHQLEGNYELAQKAFEQARDRFETVLPGDDVRRADPIHQLGNLAWKQGDFHRAELLMRAALSIREKALGANHPTLAPNCNDLALVLTDLGELEEAEQLMRRTLALDEKAFGQDHPEVATDLNNLAFVLIAREQPEQAKPLIIRSINIMENIHGPDHPQLATSLTNLAMINYELNLLPEAETHARRARHIQETSYGPDHPENTTYLSNLALILRNQGRNEEALPLLHRSLEVNVKAHGPGHISSAPSLNNLAMALRDAGRLKKAVDLLHRAVAVQSKAVGENHQSVAKLRGNLAWVLREDGDLVGAEQAYRQAIAAEKATLGAEHVRVGYRKAELAANLLQAGRPAEAEAIAKAAVALLEAGYPKGHWHLHYSQAVLGQVYVSLDREAEGRPMLEPALAKLNQNPGIHHTKTKEVQGFVTRLQQNTVGNPIP